MKEKTTKPVKTTSREEIMRAILARMATDLTIVLDREVRIDEAQVERRKQRVIGRGGVHISFKLDIDLPDGARQGCVLMPLPEALALAAYLMMRPDEAVREERTRTALDGPYKEALLEVGKFLAGACDAILRRALPGNCVTRSGGCQGVRAGVRPALLYHEGEELLVARAPARIHDFEAFELALLLPQLPLGETLESVSRR